MAFWTWSSELRTKQPESVQHGVMNLGFRRAQTSKTCERYAQTAWHFTYIITLSWFVFHATAILKIRNGNGSHVIIMPLLQMLVIQSFDFVLARMESDTIRRSPTFNFISDWGPRTPFDTFWRAIFFLPTSPLATGTVMAIWMFFTPLLTVQCSTSNNLKANLCF